MLYRVIGILLAAGISLMIAAQSEHGRVAIGFMRDSRTELRKVVWPTRKETAQTTLFVLAAAVVAGLFFWLIDMFLGWAVRFLTS
jgi:preprotein translocase subunit SecE